MAETRTPGVLDVLDVLDVLIVGAGPVGLSAAAELRRRAAA